MKKIGIVGLGLIGGSLAIALKENGYSVLGVEKDTDTVNYALKNGIIDESGSIASLKGCEAIFVCVPVAIVKSVCEEVYEAVGDSAIITDVASVKSVLKGVKGRIVGGHPMAGTENSGITASRAHLFENAYYVIVRYENTTDEDVEFIKNIVLMLKAKPMLMTADEHDERASKVSHLPHYLAYALVNYSLKKEGFTGTGFMDTTRIAGSDEKFWTDVATLNKENILADIEGFSAELEKIKKAIVTSSKQDLLALLGEAKNKRKTLTYKKVYLSEYTLDIDVKDEVGAIKRISTLMAENGINVSGMQIINSREGVGGALRINVSAEKDYKKALELFGLEDKR